MSDAQLKTTTQETWPTISEADIRQYETDGAVCLRGLFDAQWIELLREATEKVLAGDTMDMAKKGDKGRFAGDIYLAMKNDAFRTYAQEGPSWKIAKTLMRSKNLRFFADQLFVKEPGTTSASPWHQDQTYWPVLGEHVISVWVPMDSVTKISSGLEYIKGSHRWGRRFNPEDFGEVSLEMFHDKANEKIPDIDAHRDQYEFLSWDMEPGDCLVHHSMAVHGAGGNLTQTQRRRAISTRWFGDQAYFRPTAMFTSENFGLKAGEPMNSPMFPPVPLNGASWPTNPFSMT